MSLHPENQEREDESLAFEKKPQARVVPVAAACFEPGCWARSARQALATARSGSLAEKDFIFCTIVVTLPTPRTRFTEGRGLISFFGLSMYLR